MYTKRLIVLVVTAGLWLWTACEDGSADQNGDPDGGQGGPNDEPKATLVAPIERAGVYVLELNDGTDTLLFECTAESGGHITKFQLNGREILSQLVGSSGSTFWTSPQSDWSWPPPPAIGSNPYSVTVDSENNTIVMTSDVDASLGVQVFKKFSPDLVNMAIDLTYIIANTGSSERSFAPWEITRVLPGGLTYFGTGNGTYDAGSMQPLTLVDAGGATWFDHALDAGLSGDYKSFADGAGGWLAHAQDNVVFVKTFVDQSPEVRAPDHGEIELYVKGGAYQEIEQQGAYQPIPAGGQISWRVKWFLRSMPSGAAQAVGDQGLLDLAAALAGL